MNGRRIYGLCPNQAQFDRHAVTGLLCWLVALFFHGNAKADLSPPGDSHAIVVGINYKKAKGNLPKLENAENDAKAMADILEKNYGCYVVSLLGEKATKKAILDEIDRVLKNAGESDRLVLYFAGHAEPGQSRRGGRESLRLLPYDMDQQIDYFVDIDERLTTKWDKGHRLVILDCCHSGAVFQNTSSPFRKSSTLLTKSALSSTKPSYQILTACGRDQKAGDGPPKGNPVESEPEGHSPFTLALLEGLRSLPDVQGKDKPLLAVDLFQYVSYHDKILRQNLDQVVGFSPQDGYPGEFSLKPDPDGVFKADDGFLDEQVQQAVALAPGITGNWWFEEIPFFIPSLRSEILANPVEKTRGEDRFNWFTKDELQKRALDYLARQQKQISEDAINPANGKVDAKDLRLLRVNHLGSLLNVNDSTGNVRNVARRIVKELEEYRSKNPDMPAEEQHLLALMLHFLDHSDAPLAYETALKKYGFQQAKLRRELDFSPNKSPAFRQCKALESLCCADYGQYLLTKKDLVKACNKFREAGEKCLATGFTPFKVYLFCMESNALQQRGQFTQADRLLEEALGQAKLIDQGESQKLMVAFVHCRRAWSFMEQWRFDSAEFHFLEANRLLGETGARRGDNSGIARAFMDAGPPKNTDQSWSGKVIAFHNRHGLAMADRFSGRSKKAIYEYSVLAGDIRRELAALRESKMARAVDETIEPRLTERLQNTLERLGDCNLFDPAGDLGASDNDYRKSYLIAEGMSPDRRNPLLMKLLFKRVLSLSRVSPHQNLPLAKELLAKADFLWSMDEEEPSKGGLALALALMGKTNPASDRPSRNPLEMAEKNQFLTKSEKASLQFVRLLTTALSEAAIEISPENLSELPKSQRPEKRWTALGNLRKVIDSRKPAFNSTISRDEMELALFCLDFLMQETMKAVQEDQPFSFRHRLALLQDAETKVAFCRQVVTDTGKYYAPARNYLRKHYEAILEALIVADLGSAGLALEVAQEAVTGKPFNRAAYDMERWKSLQARFAGGADGETLQASPLLGQISHPERAILQIFQMSKSGTRNRFALILDIPDGRKKLCVVESRDHQVEIPESILVDLKASQKLEWTDNPNENKDVDHLLLVISGDKGISESSEPDSANRPGTANRATTDQKNRVSFYKGDGVFLAGIEVDFPDPSFKKHGKTTKP